MSLTLTGPQPKRISSRRINARRITRHPALMEYRRLFVLVALVNLIVFCLGWTPVDGGQQPAFNSIRFPTSC